MAGDDVKEKKPDPSIYITVAKAATGAGMSCVITYTSSTADQDFKEAIAIYPDLSDVRYEYMLQVYGLRKRSRSTEKMREIT
ncbi:hypothetical protein RND71_014850 [Anisodus tanguticus]|uniref:Uncharacterized protein n=1 Tax=Anisodus tanguticus TaxID=243964 RepID=A0AAE1VP28_9SOLA|nr:hypothetical protein RND71_014850 [Anisodus tanguticus]